MKKKWQYCIFITGAGETSYFVGDHKTRKKIENENKAIVGTFIFDTEREALVAYGRYTSIRR